MKNCSILLRSRRFHSLLGVHVLHMYTEFYSHTDAVNVRAEYFDWLFDKLSRFSERISRSTQEANKTPKHTTELILVRSVTTLIVSITRHALWQTQIVGTFEITRCSALWNSYTSVTAMLLLRFVLRFKLPTEVTCSITGNLVKHNGRKTAPDIVILPYWVIKGVQITQVISSAALPSVPCDICNR